MAKGSFRHVSGTGQIKADFYEFIAADQGANRHSNENVSMTIPKLSVKNLIFENPDQFSFGTPRVLGMESLFSKKSPSNHDLTQIKVNQITVISRFSDQFQICFGPESLVSQ